ncbi:MAG: hypothetical protein ACJ72Q_07265 [Nitrososphaeraceae archaeon]
MTDYPLEEMQKAITRILEELRMNPPQESTDPNMSIAYEWSKPLEAIDSIPESLHDVINRAKYLDFVYKNMIAGSKLWELNNKQQIESFLTKIDEGSIPWIYDIADGKQRINITLRLWAGCLDAAKYLQDKYVSRRNDGTVSEAIITPDMRAKAFKKTINPKASLDTIYYTGVEAAPVLRKIREQPTYSDGIPSDSPVMNHLNI